MTPAKNDGPPRETTAPAIGPNTKGLADQARNAHVPAADAGTTEPAPDPAATERRVTARTRRSRQEG